MSEPSVLRLDAYRERRELRVRLGASLHRADPGRTQLFSHLVRASSLLGTDRAAVVWIDEYGPGLVHPYVVLDLISDRPRRAFSTEALLRAWEGGVPGIFEGPGVGPGRGEGRGWSVSVALGSDGTRSWFFTTDSVSDLPPISAWLREQILFLAGESSAVVLHRDLDAQAVLAGTPQERSAAEPRFAGWTILRDLEGREDDEAEGRRIATRFLVARLPLLLVEDDLVIPEERFREQAGRARLEVAKEAPDPVAGSEGALWYAVLDAFQDADMERLARSLLPLGEAAEASNHVHGALDLYRTAYSIFAATAAADGAVEAARFSGRVLRRLAKWEEAARWYSIAGEVANAVGLRAQGALVLGGMASLHRDRGNLPEARRLAVEALAQAEASGSSTARGDAYLGLTAVDHLCGNLADAVRWGWKAVDAFGGGGDRVVALAALAGVLLEAGDVDAAADAWSCVRELSKHGYYRLYAVEALGHIAALKGDSASFARLSAEADAREWSEGPPSAQAELLLYRGLSLRALGETARARDCLQRALHFAEEHRFGRTLFQAEAALKTLEAGRPGPEESGRHAPVPGDVRTGLKHLRRTVEAPIARV